MDPSMQQDMTVPDSREPMTLTGLTCSMETLSFDGKPLTLEGFTATEDSDIFKRTVKSEKDNAEQDPPSLDRPEAERSDDGAGAPSTADPMIVTDLACLKDGSLPAGQPAYLTDLTILKEYTPRSPRSAASSDEGQPVKVKIDAEPLMTKPWDEPNFIDTSWLESGTAAGSRKSRRSGRPCKGKRDRYRKFVTTLEEQIMKDPSSVDLDCLQLPGSVSRDDATQARLLGKTYARLRKALEKGMAGGGAAGESKEEAGDAAGSEEATTTAADEGAPSRGEDSAVAQETPAEEPSLPSNDGAAAEA